MRTLTGSITPRYRLLKGQVGDRSSQLSVLFLPILQLPGSLQLQATILRTTCATYSGSRELGGLKDAQAILRHSSPETTGRTYMQAIAESVKSTMRAVAEKVRAGQDQN